MSMISVDTVAAAVAAKLAEASEGQGSGRVREMEHSVLRSATP